MPDLSVLDRRALLGRAALLLGVPASAGFGATALAQAAGKTKPSLAPPVFALLSAVADTIIPVTDTPGAVDARVPALFDGLLVNWASADRRTELLGALSRIDQAAQSQHGAAFAKLALEARNSFLAAYDAEAMKPASQGPKARVGLLSLGAGSATTDPGYAKLKELVLVLYYNSEIALTRELHYEHAPGQWKPSIPITPDTRPQGGTSY